MSDRLTTLAPVEFDTELAALDGDLWKADRAYDNAREYVMHAAEAKRMYGRGPARWNMTYSEALAAVTTKATDAEHVWKRNEAQSAVDKVTAAKAACHEVRAKMAAYHDAFEARGGWTRAFLVTDGHVHSSMRCSTCNNGEQPTQFTWLTEFSDHDESEIVEAAASRACTVCYPSAPVATAGESLLMTPDERTRAEKRHEAAQAKIARQAAKVEKGLTADGSEFICSYPDTGYDYVPNPDGSNTQVRVPKVIERREYFKTERAASNWIMQYGTWDNGLDGEKATAFTAIIEAIAAKHGRDPAEVRAEFETKIAKKRKKEGYPA